MLQSNIASGLKLAGIRKMTQAELEAEGWDDFYGATPSVLEFADGSKIYPSADIEGNGPGALFGVDANGESFLLA